MNKPYHLIFGSFFAFTAVIAGAFGAHILKDILEAPQLSSFETAVRYQMYHAIVLVVLSMKGHSFHLKRERWITSLFGIGIVLFSGSIYLLTLGPVFGTSFKWVGPITPLGGTLLIIAWVVMLNEGVALLRAKRK
jgi:uncharacterized membrane protein YgdD (TMEM256/DUF423 family)